jgi:hypothetical protein
VASRTFDVIEVTEILMHRHAGRSENEMARSFGGAQQAAAQVHRWAAGIVRRGRPKSER